MKQNKFLYAQIETIYTQDGYAVLIEIHRKHGLYRSWSIERNVERLLKILNSDNYVRKIDKYGKMTVLPYRYDPLSKEGHYREVLTCMFDWLENNVDGYLEPFEEADHYWHMLGAIVGGGSKYYWTKLEHREAFLEDEKYSSAWEALFKMLEVK